MYDSFVFYRSFAEALRELPAEEYKEIMVAISDYAMDGIEPENFGPVCKAFFILCKPQIDANNARRESGRKGGMKQTEASDKQTEANSKQTEANENVNVNDIKEKPSKEGKKKSDLLGLDDPVLLAAVKDYENHRKKIKAPLTERALDLALKKLEELAPGDTPTKVAIINQSIMNGWKGLFALHENNRSPNDKHGITRDDDLDGRVMLQAAARLHNGFGVSAL